MSGPRRRSVRSGAFFPGPRRPVVMDDVARPAWLTALGTAGGYLVLLAVVTLLLFVVPYLVFVAL